MPPSFGPHCPPFSPSLSAWAPLAQLDWVQHPGPRPAAAAGGTALAGGPGQGLMDRGRGVLPLGAAEHTAARKGGHREIGKRGPERVRHDPAAATWWQVRQRRRRGERARWAEAGAAAGRGGRGRGGPCAPPPGRGRCWVPARQAPPAPAPGASTRAGVGAPSPAHLSPRLTCCFSGAGANPSGRQRNKKIEVSMGQQLLPESLLSPLEVQKLGGIDPSLACHLHPWTWR